MFQHEDKTYITSCDSVAEFVEQAMRPCKIPHNIKNQADVRDGRFKKGWHGMDGTIEDLKRIMRDGDKDGAEKVRDMASGLKVPLLDSIRRRPQWADQGDEFCIDRMRAGQLDVMWRRPSRRMANVRPNVHLVVDYCENGSMNADTLSLRGAACLALADVMSAAGYNVKISGYQSGRNSPITSIEFLTIKDYQSPLDVASLSSVICLTAFFRVMGFMKIIKACDDVAQPVSYGYGRARHLSDSELVKYGLVGPSEYLISVPNWADYDLKAVKKWLEKAVSEQSQAA